MSMPDGTRILCSRDGIGNDLREVDKQEHAFETRYLGSTSPIEKKRADDSVLRFEYDTLERLRAVVNPRGERHEIVLERDPSRSLGMSLRVPTPGRPHPPHEHACSFDDTLHPSLARTTS